MKPEFFGHIPEKSRISNFMKNLPMEAELVHLGRRMEMTNLIVAFGNFAKAPKNHTLYLYGLFFIITLPLLSLSPRMYLSF
jgi:hypothetical protein